MVHLRKIQIFRNHFGIIFKRNLPLYKGFMLKITYKWWPRTTLNRWPLYQIKIYSKMHRESMKDTVMSRWPLYKGDRCDRFDCICIQEILSYFCHCQKKTKKLEVLLDAGVLLWYINGITTVRYVGLIPPASPSS